MAKARIKKTSLDSADVEPIVIRDGKVTRLVFRAQVVNNVRDQQQPVKGSLVWQRRTRADASSPWQDETHFKLTSMQAGTGIQLSLKTDELFLLTQVVRGLYGKFWKAGNTLPADGDEFELADYAKIARELDATDNIADLFNAVGEDAFGEVVRLLTDGKNAGTAVEQLAKLKPDDLADLGAVAGLSACREAVDLWLANSTEPSEEFWQKALTQRSFVLSQVFSAPVLLLCGKSYVGGKDAFNKGGKETDFLLRSALTGHLLLVEIKTPTTQLLEKTPYRNGVYAPSTELAGAVAQISVQRDTLVKEFNALRVKTEDSTGEKLRLAEPRCLVVAGSTDQLAEADQKSAFELFRAGQRQVDVIAFDELFGKVQCLIDLLGQPSPTSAPEGEGNGS